MHILPPSNRKGDDTSVNRRGRGGHIRPHPRTYTLPVPKRDLVVVEVSTCEYQPPERQVSGIERGRQKKKSLLGRSHSDSLYVSPALSHLAMNTSIKYLLAVTEGIRVVGLQRDVLENGDSGLRASETDQ